MVRRRVATIILSSLGVGLLFLTLVLWAQSWLARTLVVERERLYLAYDWLPDPTVIPPTATPLPTPTILPTPTATPTSTPPPLPQPPVRLAIPKIGVNSPIHPIGVEVRGNPLNPVITWPKLRTGVAHDRDSSNPGEAGNILLFGHNNYAGQVFRRLSSLE